MRASKTRHTNLDRQEDTGGNRGFNTLAVQWLNEVKFFHRTLVLVDSIVFRYRQLLIAAKLFRQF